MLQCIVWIGESFFHKLFDLFAKKPFDVGIDLLYLLSVLEIFSDKNLSVHHGISKILLTVQGGKVRQHPPWEIRWGKLKIFGIRDDWSIKWPWFDVRWKALVGNLLNILNVCGHITYGNLFTATWIQKARQNLMKTQKLWKSELAVKKNFVFVAFSEA